MSSPFTAQGVSFQCVGIFGLHLVRVKKKKKNCLFIREQNIYILVEQMNI